MKQIGHEAAMKRLSDFVAEADRTGLCQKDVADAIACYATLVFIEASANRFKDHPELAAEFTGVITRTEPHPVYAIVMGAAHD